MGMGVLATDRVKVDLGGLFLGGWKQVWKTIHSFSTCLLSTYTVPGSVLDAGDTAVNKTDEDPRLSRTFALVGQEMCEVHLFCYYDYQHPPYL